MEPRYGSEVVLRLRTRRRFFLGGPYSSQVIAYLDPDGLFYNFCCRQV